MNLIDFDSFIIYGGHGSGKSSVAGCLATLFALLGRQYNVIDGNMSQELRNKTISLHAQGLLGKIKVLHVDDSDFFINNHPLKNEMRISCNGRNLDCSYLDSTMTPILFSIPINELHNILSVFKATESTRLLKEKYTDENLEKNNRTI